MRGSFKNKLLKLLFARSAFGVRKFISAFLRIDLSIGPDYGQSKRSLIPVAQQLQSSKKIFHSFPILIKLFYKLIANDSLVNSCFTLTLNPC